MVNITMIIPNFDRATDTLVLLARWSKWYFVGYKIVTALRLLLWANVGYN